MAWVIAGKVSAELRPTVMDRIPFPKSLRAKFFAASLVLLLIPVIGVLFVREWAAFLRTGQEQVTQTAAKLVAASLSDRVEINLRVAPIATDETQRERDRVVALFQAEDASLAASLGNTYQPNRNVERLLGQSGLRDGRIWVIDAAGRVRGLGGELKSQTQSITYGTDIATKLIAPLARAIMPLMLPRAPARANLGDTTSAVFAQAQRAASGQPTTEWRRDYREQRDSTTILSVAEPIWQNDSIVGAVVVEETDAPSRNLARSAAESVIIMTLLVFAVAFGVLVWFAYRLTKRLTRLQRELGEIVDSKGRVRLAEGTLSAARDTDEVGALAQTLQAMAARQSSYNQYLEQLAARLSHELRTPVAVVRSSLDNLRGAPIADADRVFLQRADEGVARLSSMISRMSEATQLERMLQGADRERFDFNALIRGCVEGYRLAFPQQPFTLQPSNEPVWVMGVPDAIAQMLDKLVQNAVDFAAADTAIVVAVNVEANHVVLRVSNKGPLLPSDSASLFDSMVSVRQGAQQDNHLGLGLYIARLVAEFHQGRISAANLSTNDGVEMMVTLPRRH